MKALLRYKTSTLLNVLGLGIALATAYVIGVQIYYTMTYNSNIPDSERVYLLEFGEDKKSAFLSYPFGTTLGEELPAVEAFGICQLNKSIQDFTIYDEKNKQKIKAKSREMSASATDIMGFVTEEGDLKKISQQGNIAISRSFADRWKLKVGDRVQGNMNNGYQIVGIYSDMPDNCTLANTDIIGEFSIHWNINNTSNWNYNFIYKMRSDASPEDIDIVKQIMKASSQKKTMANSDGKVSDDAMLLETVKKMKIELTPMSRFYLHDSDQTTRAEHSSQLFFNTCCAIFVLILFVAFSNYVNFYMALVPRRIRGVNIQKVFGYSNTRLRSGIVLESVALVALALLFAALLVVMFTETSVVGFFNADVHFSNNITVVCGIVVTAIILAVAASLYPAYYITSMPPVMSINGSFGNTRRGKRFRIGLLLFQFAVALTLIISSLFVFLQYRFMMTADLGFRRDCLMTVRSTPWTICGTFDSRMAFESKMRRCPLIADVAWSSGSIVQTNRMGWGRDLNQHGKTKNVNFQVFPVSWNFLKMLGIPIIEGRNFTKNDERGKGTAIFNMTAKRQFQASTDDQFQGIDTTVNVVGICGDIRFRPMRYESEPLVFYVFGENSWGQVTDKIYFRTAPGANIREVKKAVTDMILETEPGITPEDIEIEHFDEQLGREYENEQNMSAVLGVFAFIAVVIALIGVFGLVLFDTQYRRSEIAIRRVFGTSVKNVLRIYIRQYLIIVVCSFVPSALLSYVIVSVWLESYANHVELSWWVFALALLFVMATTLLIVVWRSIKVATENPINALRSRGE